MPNWCYNRMTVYGDADELRTFVNIIELPEEDKTTEEGSWNYQTHSLTRLMPMPLALEGTTSPTPESPDPHPNWANLLAEGKITQEWHDELCQRQVESYEAGLRSMAETGYANWYEWQHRNWGIKWGDCRTVVEYEDGDTTALLSYDTPWAPFGDSFMGHVSETFPKLTFGIMMTEEANFYAGADKWHNGTKDTVDVDIEYIINSVPEADEDDSDAEYERYIEIDERIRDAAESAATSLGF